MRRAFSDAENATNSGAEFACGTVGVSAEFASNSAAFSASENGGMT
jgi:hypothetical protein